MSIDEKAPPERTRTVREALHDLLRDGPHTIRDLSIALGAKEKDLLDHLEHLARSLEHGGERLVIEPSRCLACGYEFEDRTRLAKPSRCPACKSTRISHPKFVVRRA